MQDKIALYQERIGIAIDVLADEIKSISQAVANDPLVAFRVKNPDTLRKKMALKRTGDVFSIDDVYGIRVIVKSVEEAYVVLAKISQEFRGYLVHDYFEKIKPVPSVNGQVLRLLQFVAYKNGVTFEIQITTVAYHAVNESLHEGYCRRRYHS